jgi:hypothetical protein
MKVDVLALGMLTCMKKAFDFLAEHKGVNLDLATIPAEDPRTYAMIRKADTLGTFQIESRAQMSMLPRIKPRTFYDLVVQVAIVRPGPIQGDMVHPYLRRREGLEPVVYPKPELAVEPQHVVTGKADPADWRFGSDTAMRAMPVVAVKPEGEFGGAVFGRLVGSGVSPLAQAGLDEALGLSVGLWRVRFGSQMLDFEPAQGLGVAAGSKARAIVGHDALDLDAEASKEAQGVEEKMQAGASLLIGQDFRIGEPRMVVDRQMHIFPADPSGLALARAVIGDAVADPIELAELFDVDVDDLARAAHS